MVPPMAHIPRLYVETSLTKGQAVPLSQAQARHLFFVLRMAEGAEVRLFNGSDGEWQARITEVHKRGGVAVCDAQTVPQFESPDLWLLFAPLRKARTDYIVEKGVELGCARLWPIVTEFTQSDRLRQDKLLAHAVGAAEQCGAVSVPDVEAPTKLGLVLESWDPDRQLIFCDEVAEAGVMPAGDKAALLIGPEGGFSPAEREQLRALPFASTVSLGPRILRADTAAVAAVTLWQAQNGDWA